MNITNKIMTKEKMIRNYIDSGEHVFISLTPTIGEVFSAEGVIRRLAADGNLQIEFMGSIDSFHISQVESVASITD